MDCELHDDREEHVEVEDIAERTFARQFLNGLREPLMSASMSSTVIAL